MDRTARTRILLLVAATLMVLVAVGTWSKRANFQAAHAETMRLTDGHPLQLRCFVRDRAEWVTYHAPDSLQIVADVYEPAASEAGPAVILLHGSYRAARRHPFVRVLAERLRRKGYVVLAPDARAYGESENPPDLSDPASFDFPGDVSVALDFLLTLPAVDPERIYLLGHSFGGGVAIAAEAREPRLAKVVVKGPSRRLEERVLGEGAPDRDYFMSRWASDMDIPGPLDFAMWSRVRRPLDLSVHADRYADVGHTPLLLVDAGEEDPRDLEWLQRVHEQMHPSVGYWTVPGAHHYLRTGTVLRMPCYGTGPMDLFVEYVDDWLRKPT